MRRCDQLTLGSPDVSLSGVVTVILCSVFLFVTSALTQSFVPDILSPDLTVQYVTHKTHKVNVPAQECCEQNLP